MGAPYSLDLRERVVAAVASGVSRRAAAERFDVSISTAIRWTRRMKETGSSAAPITLNALLSELHARGVRVSYYGVWHFVTASCMDRMCSLTTTPSPIWG
jgi:putative transposase